MKEPIKYQKIKVGNKKVMSNIPKELLNINEIKCIENIVNETTKEIDKKIQNDISKKECDLYEN